MKLSPATIVEYIHREIANQSWDWDLLMKAGQKVGAVQAKARYEPWEFSRVLLKLCREALKAVGTAKAKRKPRGPVPWRAKLLEMWNAGELTSDQASDMIQKFVLELTASQKPITTPPPKQQTWACSGTLGSEFKIEHATAVALVKAIEHLGYLGGEPIAGERSNRKVNEIILAAAEAVTNFVPKTPMGFRAPIVFKARDEKHSEREMRLMLETLAK